MSNLHNIKQYIVVYRYISYVYVSMYANVKNNNFKKYTYRICKYIEL